MLTTLTLPDGSPCQLSYESWGDEHSNHILFCVHGLTRNAMDFEKLALAAAGKGYRVIAPDIVGRGKSPNLANPAFYNNVINANLCLQLLAQLGITPAFKPPSLVKNLAKYACYKYKTLGKISAAIKHILPQAAESEKKLYWVGTSMGGMIAMLVANQAPNVIQKLVLNDVGCVVTAASLRRIGQYVGHNPSLATFAEAEQSLRARTAAFGIPEADWSRFAANSIVQEASGFRLAYDPAIAKAFALSEPMTDILLWPFWEAVKVIPTLLIRGNTSDLLTEETAS